MNQSRFDLFRLGGLKRASVLVACACGILVASPLSAEGASRSDAMIAADDAKSVFYDGTHDEALAELEGTDRVLVLYFTAAWCGPCQKMQRTTWVDERVVERLTTDGLVVKIDVDEQRELAQRYQVRAMPTMLGLRGGAELDRIVGARSAADLLDWFDTIQNAKVEQPEVLVDMPDEAVQARYRRAQRLLREGEYEVALPEFEWLWENTEKHAPSMSGVRMSFMLSNIQQLCEAYEPAMESFTAKRDALAEEVFELPVNPKHAADFTHLNHAIGDELATLRWYETAKDWPNSEPLLMRVSIRLRPLLMESGRWAEAGRLLRNPVARTQQNLPRKVRSTLEVDAEHGMDESFTRQSLEWMAVDESKDVVSLIAADREKEAVQMAAIIVRHLESIGREQLARVALDTGIVIPLHLELLEGMPETDRPEDYDRLRADLQEAIANQQG